MQNRVLLGRASNIIIHTCMFTLIFDCRTILKAGVPPGSFPPPAAADLQLWAPSRVHRGGDTCSPQAPGGDRTAGRGRPPPPIASVDRAACGPPWVGGRAGVGWGAWPLRGRDTTQGGPRAPWTMIVHPQGVGHSSVGWPVAGAAANFRHGRHGERLERM